jgi:hypothetical protein
MMMHGLANPKYKSVSQKLTVGTAEVRKEGTD